jgi:dCMP deaminase
MSVVYGEVLVVSNKYYQQYLKQAYELAAEKSSDQVTHLGALLVSPFTGNIVASGYNAFTDASQYFHPENHLRPRKYKVTEHAERWAIFDAARRGISTGGLLLVCPWASCPDCARAIVLSGITKVIGHKQALDRTPDRWKVEIDVGFEILHGGGVEYVAYDGKIGNITHLFDGKLWAP